MSAVRPQTMIDLMHRSVDVLGPEIGEAAKNSITPECRCLEDLHGAVVRLVAGMNALEDAAGEDPAMDVGQTMGAAARLTWPVAVAALAVLAQSAAIGTHHDAEKAARQKPN